MKWECIGMDLITTLPKVVGNFDSIFVVANRLTKVAHLIFIQAIAIDSHIAQLFVREIIRLYRVRAQIASDRDVKFTSNVWNIVFQSLGNIILSSQD